MKTEIYEYKSYKQYLNDWLDDPARGGGYGSRAKFAKAIGCQTSYIAQVLKGSAHLSLEQLEAANSFMGHSEQEGLYLLTLLQYERAGTSQLQARFKKQLDEIKDSRLLLKNRLGVGQPLSPEQQAIYYSAWYYSAIHLMVSQSRFQSAKSIAEYLGLDVLRANSAIQFLLETGLIEKKGSHFRIGQKRIHLGSDSPLISKHHINWRLQAIRALEKDRKENLHYSSVVTILPSDALRVRELMTKTIGQAKSIIKDSADEDVYGFSIDFFNV
jgi:uncharacterized protein (TIGR02147 family)